ncbi:MAG: hypothetical protein JJU45_13445 [Acidimicrobiia bacterium]|nr:hypothetical protein [Acidimicrobiia bacterium]
MARPHRHTGAPMTGRRSHRGLRLVVAAFVVVGLASACSEDEVDDEEAFCAQLTAMADLDERLTPDAEGLRAGADELAALEELAPVEVASEVTTLREAADTMAAAAEQGTREQAVAEPLRGEVPIVNTASARLADYARQTCDIDLGGPATTDSGPAVGGEDEPVAPDDPDP